MAVLTAEKRKNLRSNQFALPKKREDPINDIDHGRKALQLLPRQHATAAEKKRVRAAVHSKYPSIGEK